MDAAGGPNHDMPRSLSSGYLASLASRVADFGEIRARIESAARDLGADRVAVESAKLARMLAALNESAGAAGLAIARPQDPVARKDNSPEVPSPASGRTVRQDTERQFRQAGSDDYNPPGHI